MMEQLFPRVIVSWTKTPVEGFTPSAGGLIALADLSTISRRTAIAGGSSWLDALLLAPGLHYQQAADALMDGTPSSYSAVEMLPGKTSLYSITNPATIRYLQRVATTGQNVVINVAPRLSKTESRRETRRRQRLANSARISHEPVSDIGWFSHVLYLASPCLTAISLVFMVLLEDWWGLGLLLALMFSRILNIWVIKQRAKPPIPIPHHPTSPDTPSKNTTQDENFLTEYMVDVGQGRTVCLRGLADDLRAITTASWLSTKTHVQGYLEATAKLTVYLVAAFSGQLSQVGSIIFMGLLLVTAGLLGLSNAHAKHMQMHGRVAVPSPHSPAPSSSSSSWRGAPPPSSPSSSQRHLTSPGFMSREQSSKSDDTAAHPWPFLDSQDEKDEKGKDSQMSRYGSPSWPPSTMTRCSSSDLHDYEDLAEKGQLRASGRSSRR